MNHKYKTIFYQNKTWKWTDYSSVYDLYILNFYKLDVKFVKLI